VDADNRQVRFARSIPAAQARLGTGIVTLSYPGNERTRPQEIRLRAAGNPAKLKLTRPRLREGRLQVAGTVTRRARGVVRILIEFQSAGGVEQHQARARIKDGAWKLNERLPAEVNQAIEQRTGELHSYVTYTGSFPERIRGELKSFQVDVSR
jgi:hypothetical protein